jgi:hypothetical protein
MGCAASADVKVHPAPQKDLTGRFFEYFEQENFGGGLQDYQDGLTAMYAAPFPELLFEDAISTAAHTMSKARHSPASLLCISTVLDGLHPTCLLKAC